ncbi:MAG: hypothetical protein LAKADJCE_01000 [Candidatus Argoarchaeum ethanivorans]|uniref:Uncharacterized protein n=1 Tax=Candidatus Argoarchaeum ethanivorans TaxID=2608793 RepID=A0A811THG9_9EURY|nr:MAG: hypothetical protein LAKADJCE_01000 [Candidatus Argoarchaeum ethanivorans]
MAVNIERYVNFAMQASYQLVHFRGYNHTHGIWYIYNITASRLNFREYSLKVGEFCSCGIHCREHAFNPMVLDVLYCFNCHPADLILRFLDCVNSLNIRGGYKSVHHIYVTANACINVIFNYPGKSAYICTRV